MSGLSFLNPWIALGALGVAAPIIIHFFFRRRARDFEFSAMRFVILSYKKVARKLLLQEYLLLAARCLMVALLALALAVPLIKKSVVGIKRGQRPIAAVFVLDSSLSMTRAQNNGALFDDARKDVEDWIAQLTENDRAGIVDAVRLTRTDMGSDHKKLAAALAAINPTYSPARMGDAIAMSASMLSDLSAMDRMVLVFTDMQRTGWTAPASKTTDLPPLYIIDMARDLKPDNLSLSDIAINWKALAREEAAQISVKVHNYGVADARKVLLRAEFGEETAAQGFVDVPAGGEAEKAMILTDVPSGAGAVRLMADDGIPGDNAQYFSLKGGHEVRALMVDGDPATGYLDAETYFLNQALNPRLYVRSRVSPRTVTVGELASVNFADYQAVVLANVGKLGPATVKSIKQFVQSGGGLLLTLGGNVDADLYNALWGDLLPRELRGVLQPYAGAQSASSVRVMHLETPASGAGQHPVLSIFSDVSQGDLGLAGFTKYFVMQQEVTPKSTVILRLTDGTPMMVEGRYGKGKVIVFASSADRAWNDLCIHPTYLPLFQQAVQYLADALMAKDSGRIFAGAVVELPVGSDVAGARVMAPDQKIFPAELIAEQGARRIRITDTALPGVYYVLLLRDQSSAPAAFSVSDADRTIVLNVDPAESDLARLSLDEIKARLGSGAVRVSAPGMQLDPDSPAATETHSYAALMLWALIGLAVMERALTRKG
ncbi:MAG TPA: BatA domain-containing protein [bacterium]|nr:BatA domain-containing protein [bacterium]